jgi:hypothetical protein
MKITLENKEYELDITRAKELGVLKEPKRAFKVGDIYVYKGKVGNRRELCIVCSSGFNKDTYFFCGLEGTMKPFSNPHLDAAGTQKHLDAYYVYHSSLNDYLATIK